VAVQREHWISLEEYHEIERNSDIKYEYSNGRIYDMSGGKFAHSRIALNLGRALDDHLGDNVCQVVNSDMKVLPLGDENPSYYPDITVTCNPDDYHDDSTVIRSPRLIIEVLSRSTASKDRGEKLNAYKACKSCEEYVMVKTHHQEIVVHRRMRTGEWRIVHYMAKDNLQLVSVRLTIPVSKVYARTNIPPLAPMRSTD
jgi:Uma2 family endonuclease